MKVLYLDCGMGAAGDMLTAALYELLDEAEKEEFLAQMCGLGLPGVTVAAEKVSKCGVIGTQMHVTINGQEEACEEPHAHVHEEAAHEKPHAHAHEEAAYEKPHAHVHRGMEEILRLIAALPVSGEVKEDVAAVYGLIAEAESAVHGVPVSEIHFHEVGMMDALADITAVSLLMEMLAPDWVSVSPVCMGRGHVHCAHGILPVPAPATAYLLRGVPVYSGDVASELCTPTGAALLVHFADAFERMPSMTAWRIGYGMGKKDFAAANCVRALFGESVPVNDAQTKVSDVVRKLHQTAPDVEEEDAVADGLRREATEAVQIADAALHARGHDGQESGLIDEVCELSCNLDDMTPEEIGFATEQLYAAGALEVFTIAAGMKKNRPGVLLCVLCRKADRADMVEQMFRHTSTLGVREQICRRYVLDRKISHVQTPFGEVRKKQARGYGAEKQKYEYEDLAQIAWEQGVSLADARRQIEESGEA